MTATGVTKDRNHQAGLTQKAEGRERDQSRLALSAFREFRPQLILYVYFVFVRVVS
jgi:hypothetical protein